MKVSFLDALITFFVFDGLDLALEFFFDWDDFFRWLLRLPVRLEDGVFVILSSLRNQNMSLDYQP